MFNFPFFFNFICLLKTTAVQEACFFVFTCICCRDLFKGTTRKSVINLPHQKREDIGLLSTFLNFFIKPQTKVENEFQLLSSWIIYRDSVIWMIMDERRVFVSKCEIQVSILQLFWYIFIAGSTRKILLANIQYNRFPHRDSSRINISDISPVFIFKNFSSECQQIKLLLAVLKQCWLA